MYDSSVGEDLKYPKQRLSVVKNLPCDTGDTGSIPGGGAKIQRPAEQLSPCTTKEACAPQWRPCVPQVGPDAVKYTKTNFKKDTKSTISQKNNTFGYVKI